MTQSKYELLAISYANECNIKVNVSDTTIIWKGKKLLKKGVCEAIKEYTPDLSFTLNKQSYWVEMKGFRHFFYKGRFISLTDDKYVERKPLIINYCIENNIIFKEFESSVSGYALFQEWLQSKRVFNYLLLAQE